MAESPLENLSNARGEPGQRERHTALVTTPRNLVHLPAVKQRTNFSCGTAATLSLLRHWRWDDYARVDEADLYLPLETTDARGTEPQPIAVFLNNVPGLEAEYRHGDVTVADLERAVDLRQPPIVDLQAWQDHDWPWSDVWDAGHYVVLVGYDAERLFFMDPSTMTPGAYAYLPRAELEARWHDLTGDHNERAYRMAVFVRGVLERAGAGDGSTETATKLG